MESSTPNPNDHIREFLQQSPRILLIRLRSLGDSILTLPLIETLHRWRPALEIGIVVEAPHAPVFLGHPAIKETFVLKSRRGSESSGSSRLHIIQEIRRRKYPAVLNLHGGTTSMLLAAASGAKMRLGQGSHRYSWIYTERIPASSLIWQKETLHTVDHQLSVARWLGIPIDMTGAMLHINESARNEIDEQLTREKTSEYLVISPAATLRTKQWNEGNYAALGDLLFSRYGMKVIYTAAPHEISVLQEIQRSAKERHSYKANLGLPQLFALIERCRAFIGNDSGPMHAAAALKKPVVAIWGSSNFNAWHPWETEFEAVRSELPCMPCPGYECKAFETPQCNNIPISRVIDAVDALLQRTK